MNTYESPTIEQVGGGNTTPDFLVALVAVFLVFTAVIDVAAVVQVAAVSEIGIWSLATTTQVSTETTVYK
jgi:hypothetical protein